MRTTLNIDDDVLDRAKSVAQDQHISVGEALSRLARAGLARPVELREDPLTGLTVLHNPLGPTITSDDVDRMLAEEDLEKYQELMKELENRK